MPPKKKRNISMSTSEQHPWLDFYKFHRQPYVQKSPLSRLPSEIRLTIYLHIFPASFFQPDVPQLFASAKAHEEGSPFPTHDRVLGLARTCQQFYWEIIPLYFRTMIFAFSNVYDMYRYLYMTGDYRRPLIKSIAFWLRNDNYDPLTTRHNSVPLSYRLGFKVLSKCTGLERLWVAVSSDTGRNDEAYDSHDLFRVEDIEMLFDICRGRNLDVRVRELYPLQDLEQDIFEAEERLPLPWPSPMPRRRAWFEAKHLAAFEVALVEGVMPKSG
ncbi:hypothetical protein B0O99DRAFT_599179 [Bisporella sp. PMI_857]|nr:hypothetical protein B0O99DRAFT_599179 [Bisporella sp. PMI_857]